MLQDSTLRSLGRARNRQVFQLVCAQAGQGELSEFREASNLAFCESIIACLMVCRLVLLVNGNLQNLTPGGHILVRTLRVDEHSDRRRKTSGRTVEKGIAACCSSSSGKKIAYWFRTVKEVTLAAGSLLILTPDGHILALTLQADAQADRQGETSECTVEDCRLVLLVDGNLRTLTPDGHILVRTLQVDEQTDRQRESSGRTVG